MNMDEEVVVILDSSSEDEDGAPPPIRPKSIVQRSPLPRIPSGVTISPIASGRSMAARPPQRKDVSVSIYNRKDKTKVKIVMDNLSSTLSPSARKRHRAVSPDRIKANTSSSSSSTASVDPFNMLGIEETSLQPPKCKQRKQQRSHKSVMGRSPGIGSVSIEPVDKTSTAGGSASSPVVVDIDGDDDLQVIQKPTEEVQPVAEPVVKVEEEKIDGNSIKVKTEKEEAQEKVKTEPVLDFDSEVENRLDEMVHICSSILPKDEFEKVERKLKRQKTKLNTKVFKDHVLADRLANIIKNLLRDKEKVYLFLQTALDEMKAVSSGYAVNPEGNGKVASWLDTKKEEANVKKEDSSTQAEAGSSGSPSISSTLVPSLNATSTSTETAAAVEEKKRPILTSEPLAKNKVEGEKVVPEEPSTKPSTSSNEGQGQQKKKKNVSSRHLKKLEKALKLCHEHIQKLEEAEEDFDSEEESNYVKIDRFKKKFMQIHRKIAECRELDASLGRRQDKKFKFEGSTYPEINIKIEKWINIMRAQKKNYFPDFHDILNVIKKLNEEKNMCLPKARIDDEARHVFEAVGRKLRERRFTDDMLDLDAYIKRDFSQAADEEEIATDLPEENEELKAKLDENQKVAKEKLTEVFEEFVQKQYDRGEVAEEVPDGAGDESEDEDKDDEDKVSEEVELEDKGSPEAEDEEGDDDDEEEIDEMKDAVPNDDSDSDEEDKEQEES